MEAFQPLDRYPELCAVQRQWRTIRDEAIRARAQLTFIADERTVGATAWGVLALEPEDEDLDVVPPDVRAQGRRLAPRTIALVSAVVGIRAYAFSVLAPHRSIGAHRHHNRYVTALLTLQSEDAYLEVADQRASLKEGELLVFDYTLPHATYNHGAVDRIALLMLLPNRG